MNTQAYRELKVLEELSSNATVSQRSLSKKLEVALGLTNLMIRRLVKKGYVKAVNMQRNRIRYLITPQGLAEKTRLTYEYLEYSLYLYRRVRQALGETLQRVARSGGRHVVFFGTGEIAEIAYLMLKATDLQLVGVIDDQAAGSSFLGVPVLASHALTSLSFDCGIVGSLNGSLDGLRHHLRALGIPEEKLIVVQQEGSTIQAVSPGLDR